MKPNPYAPTKDMDLNAVTENTCRTEFRIDRLANRIARSISRRLESFEIIYALRGTGSIMADIRLHTLNDHTFYCLSPGQYLSLELSGDVEGYHITISPEFLMLSDGWANCFGAELIVPSQGELDDLIARMNDEYQLDDSASLEINRGLLRVLMLYLRRKFDGAGDPMQAASRDKLIVQRFFAVLQKFHASKKLVKEYADELCISPNYLNSVVKRHTGFRASHHIQQYIIVEAKRQVMYSGVRLKEVAGQLGFDDYAHFSKFFKNYSGMTFSDFRRSI